MIRPWQEESAYYFGKHDRREPVNVFGGYRYSAIRGGNGLVNPLIMDAVVRAIPADGNVNGTPSWGQSPQARFWLDEEKPSLWKRFRAWLDK